MSIFGTDKMNIRKKSDVKKDETVVPSNENVNVRRGHAQIRPRVEHAHLAGRSESRHNFGNGSVFGLLPAYDVVQRRAG